MIVNPVMEWGVLADLLFPGSPRNRTTGFNPGRDYKNADSEPDSEIFGQTARLSVRDRHRQ